MKLGMINQHVVKILISARENDSIAAISKRIGLSYGWTHKWAGELIKEGIFKEKWKGVILQQNNKAYRETIKYIRHNINEVGLYYSALSLFGIGYCFTKTDAVYVWTEGRYNIARYRGFYPIFIKVKKEHYPIFKWYCKKLSLRVNGKNGVFYAPQIVKDVNYVKKGEYSVEPLEETISFMKEHIYNFEPALEMIGEMYKRKLYVKYKEVSRL